ncbi:MAG TPA: carboxypeptidase-like regulatory domain-containing protein [Bryobacteraceae bacterium]|nr:carboxypeptidase-like regulatory domain-containing protein [Bryobacteraceae bacterium]
MSLLSSQVPVYAQARTGTISGQVVDANGQAVPNAPVEVENTQTGQRMTTSSDTAGNYRFDRLPSGTYLVVLPAGQRTTSDQIDLTNVDDVQVRMRTADAPATTGTSTTGAAASGAPAVVATAAPGGIEGTAQISAAFGTRKIEYLNQPNYIDRTGQAWGAYNLGLLPAGVTSAFGPAVGGQAPSSNNYHFEGVDNNNRLTGAPLVYISNEATSEFTLIQNQKSGSEFGHATGGQFNSIVRTGTNRVHGSIYNYLQNRHLNAMDRRYALFNRENSPRYDQNRLGASLGTPVIRDRVFFFGNFEYIPLGFEGAPGDLRSFAPTNAGYAALAGVPGVSVRNVSVLNQFAGTAAVGTQNVNVGGRAIPFGPIVSGRRNWQNQFVGTGAMDFNFANTDSLHLRYAHNEREASFSGAALAGFQTPVNSRSLLASVSHYHTFFSVVTNELRAGYTRWDNRGTAGSFQFPGLQAFPNISVPADVNLSFGPGVGVASNAAVNTYHLADNVAVTWRGHNLRFGFDGRRNISTITGFPAAAGQYQYSSLGRFLLDLPPDVQAQRAFGAAPFQGNNWTLYGYINDSFRAAQGLTVDLGLGYQYATVPTSIRRQSLNAGASVPGVLEFNEPQAQQWNWAPKIGVSFAPGAWQRTVFRGGFGIHYDAVQNNFLYLPSAPQMGAVAYGNLQSNTPGFLAGGGLQAPANAGASLTNAQARALTTSFYPDQRLPYSMQWNGGVQQELWRGMVVEAKYLGSRTLDIPVQTRLNTTARVSVQRSLPYYEVIPAFGALELIPVSYQQIQVGQAAPLAQYGFANPINTFINDGQSTYHALAVEVRNRFTGGLQFHGAYTWSHLIDDVAYGTVQDAGNRSADRADSVFDRRQRAVVGLLWEPASVIRDRYSIVRNVVANLALGGTFTYQSPGVATPFSGFDSNLDGDGRADRAIANPNGSGMGSTGATGLTNAAGQLVGYVLNNPNAGYIRSPLGVYVPTGRNTFRYGQINNFDVYAVKRFSYRERFGFEVRGDAYNVFNHAQNSLDPIHSLFGESNAMALTSMMIAGSSNFGNANLLSARPRTLQVALRLTF